MNYRHAYHAGNFADVVKHAALSRLVEYLKLKDKAFRVIDTHAGTGLYDLSSEEAQKTGEWQDGIGRLLEAELSPQAGALLAPYLDAVKAANPDGGMKKYPGSPLIVRHLLRPQDRLSAIELHPKDFQRLKALFAGDFQVRVIELDGWLALGAHLPPKEKRGLVLVDPPFEQEGEFDRLVDGLVARAPPLAGRHLCALVSDQGPRGRRAVPRGPARRRAFRRYSTSPSRSARPRRSERLDGSGLVVVNPPFVFEKEMRTVLPELKKVLAEDPGGALVARLDFRRSRARLTAPRPETIMRARGRTRAAERG